MSDNKRFVAFLDILGFKEIIEKNSLNDIVEIYSKTLKEAYDKSIKTLESQEEFRDEEASLKSTIISDSILFWTENDTFNGFVKLLLTIDYFIYAALRNGFLLRGAIVYDEIIELKATAISDKTLESSILIGKAITRAYTQEAKQDWCGCTVSQDAIERFKQLHTPNAANFEDLVSYGFLIKYTVPYKSGKITDEYVVNWPKVLSSKPNPDWIINAFKAHAKVFDVWEVQNKLNNTLRFMEYSWTIDTINAKSMESQ